MHKNIQPYKIEPTKTKCKSDQMSCIEFVDYISKYFKKVDADTFSILDNSFYKPVEVDHPDLLYQLLLGENDTNLSSSNLSNSNLLNKQIEINNKRKQQIRNIINKKLKPFLTFEMLREIDSEIENIMLKRKRAYKKKKKDEDVSKLYELLEKRKMIENDFVIDDTFDEYN